MRSGVVVRQLDPKAAEPETLETWCAVFTAGRAVESGTAQDPVALAQDLRSRAPDASVHRWAAWLDGRLVGAAQAQREWNISYCRLYVSPAYRTRGLGRGLLAAVLAGVEGWHVTVLRGSVVAGSSGERFATRLGAQVAVRMVVLVQRIDDAALVEKLQTLQAPGGSAWRLAHWRASAPEQLIDSYAVAKRSILDAPDAELQVQGDPWDTVRVRQWEDDVRRRSHELWVATAVDPGTGAVAGFTEVEVSSSHTASQHDTVVLPEQRGRGMGAWLKAAMTLRLRRDRPDIIALTSTVNVRNARMLALNRRLGYRETLRRLLVQADVRTVRRRLWP